MHYNVVIAGAGPAGLACAHALRTRDPALSVLLVEAGRTYRKRPCPVDRGHSCTGCGGVCNVVSGFGGCLHYGDGAKLSLLPSGRRLVPHLGAERADALCAEAYAWLTAPLSARPALTGQGLSPRAVTAFAEHDLEIREYPVAVLGESALREVIEGVHDELDPQITTWYMSEVTDASPRKDGGLRLRVDSRAGGRQVSADQLVLATGRRGVTATAALLRSLGVPLTPPEVSVGVRIEMAARLLAGIGDEHPDLKISQHQDIEHKVKTFCFCGGPGDGGGGRIKFTHYHDAFGSRVITLDGHETTERAVAGGRPLAGNFGLLCQPRGRGDAEQARASFLDTYRRLNDGRPFVQSLRAFLSRADSTETWPELRARMPFEPSVDDLVTGREAALDDLMD
ncbi:hypothetical protein AB0C89_17605 [Streptomyces sp. NPDC048491]|uniref:hypothetical protein n=1 Tax=Streptomyces sp. NPDC048491 TaxID=3157207 RepID=UPI0034392506